MVKGKALLKSFVFVMALLSGCVDKAFEPENASLEENYMKWKSLGVNDYSVVQTHKCFCIHGAMKVLVQVRSNQIVSVQDSDGVQVIKQEYWQYYKTIDQLFETANKAVINKPHSFTIEYDKVFGFPKSFFVDPIEQFIDEEYGYTTSNFKPLK